MRKEGGARKVDDDENDSDDNDNGDEFRSIAITSTVLTSIIVPAMKDLLKQQNAGMIEEKKDASETRRTSRDDDEINRVEYTTAVLECLVSFVAATCGTPQTEESSTQQQTSYNSLSFRRSTPKKKKTAKEKKPRFSSHPKEDKSLFVSSGAFAMAVSILRHILEDYTAKASSASWSRNKSADLDTFDSIGVADSSADIKIESTMPENEIPILVMHLIACLTHNASDVIKTDVVLPHLTSIVHKSMMVFLPSPEVQAHGCWTLYSLSNPLLQELIAAGSVSVLVRAMKSHHPDPRVQEYGNKSLYNLLPLLVYLNKPINNSENNDNESQPNPMPMPMTPAPPSVLIEIDGEKLEDYSSLLPGLPSIVLRGMEFHSDHLPVQQYGLLVLTRLCQHDQETYEVIISEGGLPAILHVVTTATNARINLDNESHGNNNHGSTAEKYDCLAQMACQFLRDISRPTNSSMDILRIIAVKGGMKTVLKLLDHYNQENMRCGGYANNQRFAIINIIDPAMAFLRNLMTNEDNRTEVMTFMSIIKAMKKEEQQPTSYGDYDNDGIYVCANLIPIVLKTMDAYLLDAPIQAYGCDLLGRLAQGEQSARIEIIQTTIDPDAFSANQRASRNQSRLWKKAESVQDLVPRVQEVAGHEEDDDAAIADLADQMSAVATSPTYKKHTDALETAVRAMRSHRNHHGVQERTVSLILAMVVDRDAMLSRNGGGSASSMSSSSFYLIQRLQEVYDNQRDKNDPLTLLAFLQCTVVPQKKAERLKTLTKIVDEYNRKKARAGSDEDPGDSFGRGLIGQYLSRRWGAQP